MELLIMSKLRIIVCSLACMMLLFAGLGITAEKQTVAILDFESIGSEEYLGKAVAEIIRTELVGTKKFRVAERAQIKKALSEQQLQMTGIIDDESAVQIGKLLGADLIIVGSVVKIGTSYTINSRLIDVQTGEAQLGRNVTGNDLNLLTGMSRSLIGDLFGKKPVGQVQITPLAPVQPESEKIIVAKPITPSPPSVQPLVEYLAITWDFEDPDLPGWTKSGNAFDYQPTYGDNSTARHRGQPSNHLGDYWIGGFEKRPRPFDQPGAIQGDGPQGTLTSAFFKINTPIISFLIGGGCDISKVRAALFVDSREVRSATGNCNETMQRKSWDVKRFMGKNAYIKIVDESSGGWGHINFDDVRFE
jgi:TolB-like protein